MSSRAEPRDGRRRGVGQGCRAAPSPGMGGRRPPSNNASSAGLRLANRQVSSSSMEKYQLYIDCRFVEAESGECRRISARPRKNPWEADPVASKADARRAVEAARQVVRLGSLERHGRAGAGKDPHADGGEARQPPG